MTEQNDTKTNSAVIRPTGDSNDNNVMSSEQSQYIVENQYNYNENSSLDWNANKATDEISTSNDDVVDIQKTEHRDERQVSCVSFSADEEPTSEGEVPTQDGMSDSPATVVSVVTASPSYSELQLTDVHSDDAPPPLPSSLPPSATPDHDMSQDLSVIVEDDSQQLSAMITFPPPPYASSEPDTSPTEVDSSSYLPTEQSHAAGFSEEDTTDKYSALSEEDRLLVQRILATMKERQVSPLEETEAARPVLAEDSTNNESEEKYADLLECERQLIENTLASLRGGQPDVDNDVEAADSATLPELQLRDYHNNLEGNINSYEDDLGTETLCSVKAQIQEVPEDEDQELKTGIKQDAENVLVHVRNENASSTEMEIQASSQDQELDKDLSKEDYTNEVEKGSASSSEMRTEESPQHQNQEPVKSVGEEAEVVAIETMPDEVKTFEPSSTADWLVSAANFSPDDLNTSALIANDYRGGYEEPIAIFSPETTHIAASESEEIPDSSNQFINIVDILPDDETGKEDCENKPVFDSRENYLEPTAVVVSLPSVTEVSEREELSTAIDADSQSHIGVFRDSSDNFPSDVQNRDAAEKNALAKSRRTLLSDEAVSEIMRDYYTADAEVQEEKPEHEEKPEKAKPVKPLIAQALLPKVSRRPFGTTNSSCSTTVLAADSLSQTSNSNALGYDQLEKPQTVTVSEKSEVKAAEDDQRVKPVNDVTGDDVRHDDVISTSRDFVSDTVRGAAGSTTSEPSMTADGREVPTVAESRAFFKSREAALQNTSDKSVFIRPSPVTESSSTAAVNLISAASVTSSRAQDGETQVVETAPAQRSSAESRRLYSIPLMSSKQTVQPVIATSSQTEVRTSWMSAPLEAVVATTSSDKSELTSNTQEMISTTANNATSTISSLNSATTTLSMTSNVHTSSDVHAELPKLTDTRQMFESIGARKASDGNVGLTGRVPLNTRWAPKPFSLTSTTTKSTPRFVTFEPMLPTGKMLGTTESDASTDNQVQVTKVESDPSFNAFRKTDAETAPAEPKSKWSSSLYTTTTEAGGSLEESSATDEDDWTSKSCDVDIDATGSSDVADVVFQTGEPHHQLVSAAATATQLKKIAVNTPARTPSFSGPNHSHMGQTSPCVTIGRSFSLSQVDVPPKSGPTVSLNNRKSTNRGPPTLAKSWTQFDYHKKAGGPDSRISSSQTDDGVEHIDVASSKAFFQAAEQAQKQALNQPGARIVSRKSVSNVSVKNVVTPARDNEERSTAAAGADVSSSDSSYSAHSTAAAGELGALNF